MTGQLSAMEEFDYFANPNFRSRLTEYDTKELLGRLIDHYVFLVNRGERSLVLRKLASSLVTIFLKPTAPWTRAILNVAASLVNGKYVSEEQCQEIDIGSTVLPAMNEGQVVALLYFSHILAEEINRWRPEVPRRFDSFPPILFHFPCCRECHSLDFVRINMPIVQIHIA